MIFRGSGHKQSGIGEGKKLGTGKWTFVDGVWVSHNKKITIQDSCDSMDTGKNKEFAKIGKEVVRMSKLGCKNQHKELEGECRKLMEKSPDKKLVKNIALDITKQIKERR